MEGCLFCKIAVGKIPSEKVYEDDFVLGFNDINPLAKVHVLFISKKHTENINDMVDRNPDDFAHLFNAIRSYTQREGLVKDGFRIVSNVGTYGGQTVFHTHFHLLAGEQLRGFGA